MCNRKRASHTAAAAACLVGAAVMPAFGGDSVMLKRKFKPGATHYVERKVERTQEVSGGPMGAMTIEVTELLGFIEKTESADAGGWKIVLTHDRAATSMDMPVLGAQSFDTDDPGAGPAAPLLRSMLEPLIGESYTVELDKDGKVTGFSGMDAIREKISKNAVANLLWQQAKEHFTNESGRSEWGDARFAVYPNKEVKVGDQWKSSLTRQVPRIGTVVTKFDYKLERIGQDGGREVAVVAITGTISGGDGDGTKISGTVTGSATFDVGRGLFVSRSGESVVKVKLPSPMGGEGQFMDVDITTRNRIAVKSVKDREREKQEAAKKAKAREKETQDKNKP